MASSSGSGSLQQSAWVFVGVRGCSWVSRPRLGHCLRLASAPSLARSGGRRTSSGLVPPDEEADGPLLLMLQELDVAVPRSCHSGRLFSEANPNHFARILKSSSSSSSSVLISCSGRETIGSNRGLWLAGRRAREGVTVLRASRAAGWPPAVAPSLRAGAAPPARLRSPSLYSCPVTLHKALATA